MQEEEGKDFHGVRDALSRTLMQRLPPSTLFLSFILLYGIGLYFLHDLIAEPFRDMIEHGSDGSDNSVISNRALQVFMTLVGLMFAILIGQATTLSLSRLSNVQSSINELAASMSSMLMTAHAFGEETQMKIARTMGSYIDTILDFDVENFRGLSEKESRMGDFIVRTIREGATDGEHDSFDNSASQSLMSCLFEWTKSRVAWQTSVMNRLSSLRLLNLEFLGLIAMFLMLMVIMGNPILEGFLFALAGAAMRMVLLLVLLTDSYGHSTRVSSIVNLNYDILIDVQNRAKWILERYHKD